MTQIAQGVRTKLQTGLAAGTRVMTLDGPLPVEHLTPGDRIVTRQGVRPLRGVRVTEREAGRAVTVRASALGHDRPETTITVAAEQEILIRDWRAQALFGTNRAVVPIGRLADGEYITATTANDLRMFDLVFDTPQVVYAEGAEFPMTTTREDCA